MADAIQQEIDRTEWENPSNWGGPDWMAIYFSKKDSRTWVPKRMPWMGWTLNLGRSAGVYWLVGFLTGIPLFVVAVSMGVIAATTAQGGGISSQSFPPVVVRTVPAAGDRNVDPSLREVRVTFSKDMMTKEMWSFVYANPAAFPKIAGEIRYVDARTCVLPVSLEPGQTYGMWINSREHDAFRDRSQRPAVPYLLTFQTRN